jgi:hypothetical protein
VTLNDAVGIVIAVATVYGLWRLDLKLRPHTSSCWFCRGRGRIWGSTTKRHGPCPFCKGKPRLRRGAKEP